MDTFFNNNSRRKTKVSILATFNLVREGLQKLIEDDRNLSVLDVVGTTSDLIGKVSRHAPDVVLICLTQNEGGNIEVITDLRRIVPQVKIVILSSPDSLLDQPAALKLGVTGIVGTNQSSRVLTRAINQVSEGEVWLNQKLIAKLLDGSFNGSVGKSRNRGYFKDELTSRELEVVAMIGLGMNNKDIAKNLYISEATIRHHLSSIYGKLNVDDRLNLAIYAYRQRIVRPLASVSI
jgi:two-component system, NarL family, response regulator DegU